MMSQPGSFSNTQQADDVPVLFLTTSFEPIFVSRQNLILKLEGKDLQGMGWAAIAFPFTKTLQNILLLFHPWMTAFHSLFHKLLF